MSSALVLVLEPGVVWLQREDYEVVPLNPRHSVSKLAEAIERGIPAVPDLNRPDFYEVSLTNCSAYVHVHDAARRVYLVACLGVQQ
jgi:hypothetical protein